MEDVTVIKCCGNCRHYKFNEHYCHLMDDLTEPADNCGLFKEGIEHD